ncbi:hypothetical protein OG241_32415 [Streptomyces sp. NBC_01390]|uniref:hypothetical protein n=1 Tax=Streptomyces sp. NBC_01390 TaxID=2903850 RepID=UPI00324D3A14
MGDELPTFHGSPAEHWINMRITNPIKWTFATVRPGTEFTEGEGSHPAARATATPSAFKLVESDQARRRPATAPRPVAPGRADAPFERGHLVEHPEAVAA